MKNLKDIRILDTEDYGMKITGMKFNNNLTAEDKIFGASPKSFLSFNDKIIGSQKSKFSLSSMDKIYGNPMKSSNKIPFNSNKFFSTGGIHSDTKSKNKSYDVSQFFSMNAVSSENKKVNEMLGLNSSNNFMTGPSKIGMLLGTNTVLKENIGSNIPSKIGMLLGTGSGPMNIDRILHNRSTNTFDVHNKLNMFLPGKRGLISDRYSKNNETLGMLDTYDTTEQKDTSWNPSHRSNKISGYDTVDVSESNIENINKKPDEKLYTKLEVYDSYEAENQNPIIQGLKNVGSAVGTAVIEAGNRFEKYNEDIIEKRKTAEKDRLALMQNYKKGLFDKALLYPERLTDSEKQIIGYNDMINKSKPISQRIGERGSRMLTNLRESAAVINESLGGIKNMSSNISLASSVGTDYYDVPKESIAKKLGRKSISTLTASDVIKVLGTTSIKDMGDFYRVTAPGKMYAQKVGALMSPSKSPMTNLSTMSMYPQSMGTGFNYMLTGKQGQSGLGTDNMLNQVIQQSNVQPQMIPQPQVRQTQQQNSSYVPQYAPPGQTIISPFSDRPVSYTRGPYKRRIIYRESDTTLSPMQQVQ